MQKELAKAIGLPAPTLCMIENGDREARPDEIKRIKKALKERGVDCHEEEVREAAHE